MRTALLLCTFAAVSVASPAGLVYRVPIQGTIDLGLPPFVERVIKQADREYPDAIIFDIDTFGGRLDGATRIKDAIMSSSVPTIAFINRRAISAGALISLSCEKIIMSKGATIGAATAVDLEGKKASEKVISYMREEMSATAEARGRPTRIAEAMVDEELEVPYVIIQDDTVRLEEIEGSKVGKLITLTTEKALRLGMADDMRDSFQEVLTSLGLEDAEIVSFAPSWSEYIVRFLTDPIVSSLLMTIGFLGLLFELRTPGFGVGGIIGTIALLLFFSTSFIAQLANFTEVLIFLAGLTLLILEIVAIPGFGLAGIGGIALMLWGMYKMLLGEYPTPDQIERAFIGLNIGILGAIIGTILLLRVFVTSSFFKKHVPFMAEEYSVAMGVESLVGQVGEAITECVPTGKADFTGRHVNVTTRGEHIPKGSHVEVIKVEGNTAFVRLASQTKKRSN
ncbi:MAG: nodulation protein NfeD [Fidelibacterota bacterium]|nr:MAG: nodulation protein NfeD [Candidatus Neomarinimicrobiota bacterium]